MPSLLDLMTEDDKAWVSKLTAERLNPRYKQDVPMPFYVAAQLGYYYGWQAVMDFRRGYSVGYEPEVNERLIPTGRLKKVLLSFTLEDASALIKAAEKVHYSIKLDEGRINAATNVSSQDRKYAKKNAEYVNEIAAAISDKR